jgi:hypothetical protein
MRLLYASYYVYTVHLDAWQAIRFTVHPSSTVQQFNCSTSGTGLKIHRTMFLAACSSERWEQEMRGRIGFTGLQPDVSDKESMSRAMSILCYFLSVYLKDGFYCILLQS